MKNILYDIPSLNDPEGQMETRLGEEFEEHAEGKEDTDTGIYITSSASFERKRFFFREKGREVL